MNTYQTFIGIDPGATGAIASISPTTGIKFVDCPVVKMSGKTKPNPTLMASELKQLITPDSIIIIEFVSPQCWKKYYSLGSDKESSRVKALQLFPNQATDLKLKKHHGRAEALLLAEYLKRKLSAKVA